MSGSTLRTPWGDREARWDIIRVSDDSFQVDYLPGGERGHLWTWDRVPAEPPRPRPVN